MGRLGGRLVKMSVVLWIRDGVSGWHVGEDVCGPVDQGWGDRVAGW